MGTNIFILFNPDRSFIGKVIVLMQIFPAECLLIPLKLTVINFQLNNVT